MSCIRLGSVVCALAAGALACGSDDYIPMLTNSPVVIRLVPGSATVTVGDTVPLVGDITGGSPSSPPTVARCTPTQPTVATALVTLTTCKVVGLAPGTTDIIAMASTGHVDTATVTVVSR